MPSHPAYTGPALCAKSAREMVALLKSGDISPAEALEASLSRIAAVEPSVNAMPTICAARARAAAASLSGDSAHPGWLAGLPIGIKDLNLVKGVRTTYGTHGLRDFVPETSDPLVERLEGHDGVVVGKTNTPEFGAGGNTFNDVFGPTRNPYDTRMNAGGSSGGAAASLATGEVWLSHGSDLAGSLRTPAGYCNIVGMRPTPGRAGGGPAAAAFVTEGISGPMARDVGDLALFLDAMAGFDPRQPMSLAAPAVSFQSGLEQDPGKLRIAFSIDQGGFAPVEQEVREILTAAMTTATGAGIDVAEDCPDLPGLYETYVTLRGIFYGTVNASVPAEIQAHFKETLKDNIATGLALSSAQIYDAYRQRTILYQNMRMFLDRYDCLAIPVVGLAPLQVEIEYPTAVDNNPVVDYVDWLRFSFLATTCALPAIAMPAGFTTDGMPIGIQLIGKPHGDAALLQVAQALEQALGLPKAPIDPVIRHG